MKLGSPFDFGAYASRSMVTYILLSIPAIVLEVLFSFSIASNPSIGSIGFFGVSEIIPFIPWLVTLASVYAILTFRSSLLLSLLVVGYFVEAVLAQSASIAVSGVTLDAGTAAALVVIASFLALMAFGFARSARIQSEKKAVLRSGGSIPFQVLGFAMDFAVPAVLAILLVLVTTEIFGVVKSTLESLPPPLSEIFASGLSSPFAAVALTLIVAGVTLWTVRELIEPVIMYYSITKEDAVKLLQADLKEVAKPFEGTHRRNVGGVLGTVLVIAGITAVLYFEFGLQATVGQLPALWGGAHPTQDPAFTIQTNNWFNQLERFIESTARLLWG